MQDREYIERMEKLINEIDQIVQQELGDVSDFVRKLIKTFNMNKGN